MYFKPSPEFDWQMAGKCYGDNPKKWDVESLNPLWPEREAEQLCRGCPVRNSCLLDAMREFSTAEYVGFEGEPDSTLGTEGVVRAGRLW